MLLPIILVTFLAATAYSLVLGDGLPVAPSIEALTVSVASISPVSNALRRRRGRPRKFVGPSRAVTLTLPETTLEKLSAIDSDLSRAVVAMTNKKASLNGRPPADLAVFGRRAVITIRPTRSLEQHTGIDLVPLPDGRALMMFDHPQTTAELELLILDALDDAGLDAEDRRVFEGIARTTWRCSIAPSSSSNRPGRLPRTAIARNLSLRRARHGNVRGAREGHSRVDVDHSTRYTVIASFENTGANRSGRSAIRATPAG
jgi:hypothetical protein